MSRVPVRHLERVFGARHVLLWRHFSSCEDSYQDDIGFLWIAPLPPAASHVFIVEPNLNPAVEAQAIGRAYRMGQTSAVSVYRMVVKNTVEERIQKLLERRSQAQAPTAGAGPGQDTRDKDNVAGVTEAAMGASHIRSAGTRAFTPEEVAFLVGQRATLA